jgi:hypothetical protein
MSLAGGPPWMNTSPALTPDKTFKIRCQGRACCGISRPRNLIIVFYLSRPVLQLAFTRISYVVSASFNHLRLKFLSQVDVLNQ